MLNITDFSLCGNVSYHPYQYKLLCYVGISFRYQQIEKNYIL